MREAAIFAFALATTVSAPTPVRAQDRDDFLKVYAIKVIHNRPLKEPSVGFAVYVGKGALVTAAHVLGRFSSFFTNPRVLIAGRELTATVIKEGSFATTDLAVLSVDEQQLPVSFRLRRNPLCQDTPKSGEDVVVVLPYAIEHSRIRFPTALPLEFRATSNTFIDDLPMPGGSGAGVYHAEKKCLLGILSSKISNANYRVEDRRRIRDLSNSTVGVARHFVPASVIADFIPAEFRF